MARDGSDHGVMAELVPPYLIDLYTEGTAAAELHDGLDVAPEDLVVNKTRYGAFHGTDLARQLVPEHAVVIRSLTRLPFSKRMGCAGGLMAPGIGVPACR